MRSLHIEIGTAKTLNCEKWTVNPDNRIEMIRKIGGNIVQDNGHIESGDKITCSCNVDNANKETIFTYWQNQTKVTIKDESGISHSNMRVIVTRYAKIEKFPSYWTIDFEFWRI